LMNLKTAFDPLSLASFATRRPPSLTAAYQVISHHC
jgi:hypothetical protein